MKNNNLNEISTEDNLGFTVSSLANNLDETNTIMKNNNSVGLLNTNYIYINNDSFPSEEEQFESYKKITEGLKGKNLTIQTLNLNKSNIPAYISDNNIHPFGLRGIRLSLKYEDDFKCQLRAILRASNFGKIDIIFPGITSAEEASKIRTIIDGIRDDFIEAGVPFDTSIQLGFVIDTPAAALISDRLLRYVNFLYIDLDELTKHTLVLNENMENLYSSFHPAIIQLVKRIIDLSHIVNKTTRITGSFLENDDFIKLLIGMKVDELVTLDSNTENIKNIISNSNYKDLRYLTDRILSLESINSILKFLEEN